MNSSLAREVVRMALETIRGNKLRSALTILGVVIGITSIVGVTSLLRGFDQSLRDSISQLGPDTIIVQKMGALSLIGGGKSFLELARRPNLTKDDAEAIQRDCPSVAMIDVWLGATGFSQSRIYYGHERTRVVGILGATENWSAVSNCSSKADNWTSPQVPRVLTLVSTRLRSPTPAASVCISPRPRWTCSSRSLTSWKD